MSDNGASGETAGPLLFRNRPYPLPMDASPVPLQMRQALYLTYDKNRHVYNRAFWYSLLFALCRTHEGSYCCTLFGTCEPLRRSTYLLRLYSSCLCLKSKAKVYFINKA